MLCHMRDTTPTMFARSVSNRSAFTGAMIAAFGLAASASPAAAGADTYEYAAEDGGNTNSYLNSFDANATWGNTFEAEPGYETITSVRVELGSLFTDDTRPVNILIFDDPHDDAPEFDPASAVLISHTTATAILTPDACGHGVPTCA